MSNIFNTLNFIGNPIINSMTIQKTESFRKKPRLSDIDRAKGLAIMLVVIGHIVAKGDRPSDAEWYDVLKRIIYCFHMHFFMFLSGIVYFYTYKPIVSLTQFVKYVRTKFMRVMPAYFLFAIAIWLGKFVSIQFIHVDNPAKSLNDFKTLLLYPTESFSTFLWYIYVLFIFYLFVPVLNKLFYEKIIITVLFAIILQFLPAPKIFALHYICRFFLFFILGVYVVAHYEKYTMLIDRYYYVFIFLFVITITIIVVFHFYSLATILSFLSLPTLHALVRRALVKNSNFLLTFGTYTLPIYLMNTISIGIIKAVILKFTSWDGMHFLFVAPILLISGLYIPIFVKCIIFTRIPFLDRITW